MTAASPPSSKPHAVPGAPWDGDAGRKPLHPRLGGLPGHSTARVPGRDVMLSAWGLWYGCPNGSPSTPRHYQIVPSVLNSTGNPGRDVQPLGPVQAVRGGVAGGGASCGPEAEFGVHREGMPSTQMGCVVQDREIRQACVPRRHEEECRDACCLPAGAEQVIGRSASWNKLMARRRLLERMGRVSPDATATSPRSAEDHPPSGPNVFGSSRPMKPLAKAANRVHIGRKRNRPPIAKSRSLRLRCESHPADITTHMFAGLRGHDPLKTTESGPQVRGFGHLPARRQQRAPDTLSPSILWGGLRLTRTTHAPGPASRWLA